VWEKEQFMEIVVRTNLRFLTIIVLILRIGRIEKKKMKFDIFYEKI